MIQLRGCRFSVGPRVLFDGLDWTIGPGDRCALVGPNGAGKTTLLRIALGELAPEAGERVLARGSRLGYLPQEAAERFEGTVFERALEARRDLLASRDELEALHQRLARSSPEDPDLSRLLERAGELQHRLELDDPAAFEAETRRVLSGLGFPGPAQDLPLSEFSGGWRMRAALAALLLADPTLLFLDEPTNHLDLPAMEWLEDYLSSFAGGLVVVSHDRVFLDRVTEEVRELETGRWSAYPMTFTRYLEEKERRRAQIEAQNEHLDRKIAQLNRFVERFGAKNTKASQAQSKRKQIARLESQRVVLPRRPRTVRFHFPEPPNAGRLLLELEEVGFGYGAVDVFSGADLALPRGEKAAIVGANGAGKTTLLRVLAGQLAPRAGERRVSPLTRMTYFAQHAAETLDPSLSVLEALERAAPPEWRPRLRSLLGQFLFSGDDVDKRCGILSGGERQRVALARILLEPGNLLLLDEPTHHLDLGSKEVLEDALEQYPGAIVVVTHDRSLMARIATRVIEVRDGRVVPYPGGYDDYEAARRSRERPEPGDRSGPAKEPPSAGAASGTRAQEDRKRERREATRRARDVARLAADLESRETRLRELEAMLADPGVYRDGERARELLAKFERLRAEVDSLWEKLAGT